KLAEKATVVPGLASKLQDLATLLQDYLDWLAAHKLQDTDSLLNSATEALANSLKSKVRSPKSQGQLELYRPSTLGPFFSRVWVDGFAQLSEQEIGLLAAVTGHSNEMTMAFCLDRMPLEKISWL